MPEQTFISPQAQITAAAAKTELSALHEPEIQDTSAEKLCHLTIQRKLMVGAADDPLEHEADAMADSVMRGKKPSFIQKKGAEKQPAVFEPVKDQIKYPAFEEEIIQRNESENSVPSVSDAVVHTLQSPGNALDNTTRSFMETSFGFDFGKVRIHNDSTAHQSAKDINALAYTHQNNVVFGPGQYQPQTDTGKKLLVHELTHVVQQSDGIKTKHKRSTELGPDQKMEKTFPDYVVHRRSSSGLVLARKVKVAKGEIVVLASIFKGSPESNESSTVVLKTSSGRTFTYSALIDEVPVGKYKVKKENGIYGIADLNVNLQIIDNNESPAVTELVFADEYNLEVIAYSYTAKTVQDDEASPNRDSGGFARGTGANGKAKKKSLKKRKKKKSKVKGFGKADSKTIGNQNDSRVNGEAIAGGNAGVSGDEKLSSEVLSKPLPGTVDDLPEDYKGPVIKISKPEDIDKLKALGLIPVENADEIKGKFGNRETLSIDEVIILMEALNASIELPSDMSGNEKENWLKWARFLQQFSGKISGRTKTKDKGLSVEDVKELIAKYKEFVGVTDLPENKKNKKKFEPEKRKSWNSLQQWEKNLWKEYLKRHPDFGGDSEDFDLRITDHIKMIMALKASTAYMKGGTKEAMIQMVNDPKFIAGTMLGITLYISAWLAPEPFFTKATAAAITTALLTLFTVSEIKNFAVAWMNLSDESAKAKSIDEIEEAGEHFGKAVGGILGRVLITLMTIVVGKLLPGPPAVPKGGGDGGGTAMAAAAGEGGATVLVAVPTSGIKVLADGTIVVVTEIGLMATSTAGGTGTGGGGTGSETTLGSGKESGNSKKFTPEEIAASKKIEEEMAAKKESDALAKLANRAPDLQKEIAVNKTTMADGKTTLKDLAQDDWVGLKKMYTDWKAKLAKGDTTIKDFGEYVRSRQSESRGRMGELEDAFSRGQKEIMVKAPKTKVNEGGTDSISYDEESDLIKILDNKAIKPGAKVSKVTALEENLSKNIGDDIADIEEYASDPDAPPEIAQKVLPRLKAAKADIDTYISKYNLTPEQLKSVPVQNDFTIILKRHGIERIITFGGAGKGAGISGKLSGKGFKTE